MKIHVKVPAGRVPTIRIGNGVTIDFIKKPDPKKVTKLAIEYVDKRFKSYLEGTKE